MVVSISGREYLKKYHQTDAYKEYRKKYHQSDAYKEYRKKYIQSDAYKENLKKYHQTDAYKEYRKNQLNRRPSIDTLTKDFFVEFNKNKKWQENGLEEMATIFSKTACNITERKKCELEEKILIKASQQKKLGELNNG